jgi:hypothetical protein
VQTPRHGDPTADQKHSCVAPALPRPRPARDDRTQSDDDDDDDDDDDGARDRRRGGAIYLHRPRRRCLTCPRRLPPGRPCAERDASGALDLSWASNRYLYAYAGRAEGAPPLPRPVSRPFPSWHQSVLAEIYLRHACCCHEILRTETGEQDSPALAGQRFGDFIQACTGCDDGACVRACVAGPMAFGPLARPPAAPPAPSLP